MNYAQDTTPPDLDNLSWEREVSGTSCRVSTSRDLLQLDFINDAFATQEMPWARSMNEKELRKMVDHSLIIGVYVVQGEQTGSTTTTIKTQHKQIGMARLITDHITFAYLTDVYILPEYRRFGHARWLMTCCKELLESLPAMRRGFLVTGLPYGEEFYRETLGMYNIVDEGSGLIALTGKFKKS